MTMHVILNMRFYHNFCTVHYEKKQVMSHVCPSPCLFGKIRGKCLETRKFLPLVRNFHQKDLP